LHLLGLPAVRVQVDVDAIVLVDDGSRDRVNHAIVVRTEGRTSGLDQRGFGGGPLLEGMITMGIPRARAVHT
jgi:hypothetical protein